MNAGTPTSTIRPPLVRSITRPETSKLLAHRAFQRVPDAQAAGLQIRQAIRKKALLLLRLTLQSFRPIASSEPGQAHSAEAVRQRIRQMIEDEDPDEVLSDDVIVERLRKADILVARRTVAKYRDSLRIPSSVERRKMKMAPMRARVQRDNSLTVEA